MLTRAMLALAKFLAFVRRADGTNAYWVDAVTTGGLLYSTPVCLSDTVSVKTVAA